MQNLYIALNDDYTTNWDRIEQACSSKTKMILLIIHIIPLEKILSHADFEALEQLMDKSETIPTFR
jgi:methionine aminotransferase